MMTLTRELGKLEQGTKKGLYREYGVKKAEVRPVVAMTIVQVIHFAARYQGGEQ